VVGKNFVDDPVFVHSVGVSLTQRCWCDVASTLTRFATVFHDTVDNAFVNLEISPRHGTRYLADDSARTTVNIRGSKQNRRRFEV